MPRLYDLDDVRRADYLDSRDLIELRESLVSDLEIAEEDNEGYTDDERQQLRDDIEQIDDVEECVEDWIYGATLIHESSFEDYAREFASDIGAISDDHQWPLSCIDWEQATRELAMDFTTVEIAGESFYVR